MHGVRNVAGEIAGTRSLAIAAPGVKVRFTGKSHTVHTMTALLFPQGALGMPFDAEPRKGSGEAVLTTPCLYVFFCKIHPENAGMGGQGVLAVPVVYNGWVQNLPGRWKAQLSPAQRRQSAERVTILPVSP